MWLVEILVAAVVVFVVRRLARILLARASGIPTDTGAYPYALALWTRTTGQTAYTDPAPESGAGDRALAYVDRVVDRTINKCRGVLPFNSLLLTLTVFLVSVQKKPSILLVEASTYLSLGGVLISSLIALLLFQVRWGHLQEYKSYAGEFQATVELVRRRSMYLQIAIALSIVGLLGTSVLIIDFLWLNPPA